MSFGMPGPTGKPKSLKGTGAKSLTMQNFSPEQMQMFQQMFGRLGPDSFMGKLASGDQSQFEQMEAPAMRQFAGLQGNIASRFSGQGTGARRSSGFAKRDQHRSKRLCAKPAIAAHGLANGCMG